VAKKAEADRGHFTGSSNTANKKRGGETHFGKHDAGVGGQEPEVVEKYGRMARNQKGGEAVMGEWGARMGTKTTNLIIHGGLEKGRQGVRRVWPLLQSNVIEKKQQQNRGERCEGTAIPQPMSLEKKRARQTVGFKKKYPRKAPSCSHEKGNNDSNMTKPGSQTGCQSMTAYFI